MKKDVFGARFSVPYEIAVIRPLRQTTVAERRAALEAAHWNTELLPQDLIYIDLCTDSGVSAVSTTQLSWQIGLGAVESGMGLAAEASRAFQSLARQCQETFGFDFVIPTTQGRAAERVWIKLHVKPNTVVLGNMLFPSTRTHIEMNGGLVVDVIGDGALDLKSDEPFKGNVDLKKVEAAWREHGKDKISCIYIELSVNACGGHPVSLQNLRQVRDFATANGLRLFLDACRIFENSHLIQQREAGYDHRSIAEIVRETCSLADGMTMSALKDLCVPSGGLICSRDRGGASESQHAVLSRWHATFPRGHGDDRRGAPRNLRRRFLYGKPGRTSNLFMAQARWRSPRAAAAGRPRGISRCEKFFARVGCVRASKRSPGGVYL